MKRFNIYVIGVKDENESDKNFEEIMDQNANSHMIYWKSFTDSMSSVNLITYTNEKR